MPSRRRAPRLPRPRALAAFWLAAAFFLGGCDAFTLRTPKPTPTDFAGIVAELAVAGIVVDRVTSGDAGCEDQRLARTAIGFDARGAGQADPVRVRLYAFRNRKTYDELRPAVDLCARAFVSEPAAYVSIDAAPYVLAGNGPWNAAFVEALRGALGRAAVGG